MADKQLKANRKFMEEQAAERENERDEFSKELQKLKIFLKEKDKDKTSHENYEKEVIFLFLDLQFCLHCIVDNHFLLSHEIPHKIPLFFLLPIFFYARTNFCTQTFENCMMLLHTKM